MHSAAVTCARMGLRLGLLALAIALLACAAPVHSAVARERSMAAPASAAAKASGGHRARARHKAHRRHRARGQPGAGASPPGIRGRPPQGPPPQGMPEALQAGCAQAPQRSLRLHPRAEPADRLVPFYGRRLPRLEGLRRLRLRGRHEHGDRAPARGARREHPGQ